MFGYRLKVVLVLVLQEADTDDNQGTLGFEEFCSFYKMMSTRRDLYLLMLTYSNHKDHMDTDDLTRFLEHEQKVTSCTQRMMGMEVGLGLGFLKSLSISNTMTSLDTHSDGFNVGFNSYHSKCTFSDTAFNLMLVLAYDDQAFCPVAVWTVDLPLINLRPVEMLVWQTVDIRDAE